MRECAHLNAVLKNADKSLYLFSMIRLLHDEFLLSDASLYYRMYVLCKKKCIIVELKCNNKFTVLRTIFALFEVLNLP